MRRQKDEELEQYIKSKFAVMRNQHTTIRGAMFTDSFNHKQQQQQQKLRKSPALAKTPLRASE